MPVFSRGRWLIFGAYGAVFYAVRRRGWEAVLFLLKKNILLYEIIYVFLHLLFEVRKRY